MNSRLATAPVLDDAAGLERAARTEVRWQQFSVPYHFPVVFTEAVFAPDNPVLLDVLRADDPQRRPKCLIYIDEGLQHTQHGLDTQINAWFELHREQVELAAPPTPVCGGEHSKHSFEALHFIHQQIDRHGLDRHGYVIAIGGGAVLDAVGFMAATAHRGIRHVRLPSTVLAQNDSGVGVKNGINYFGQKNWLGTFTPPHAVINDLDFIASLPTRDRISGTAEAVKVALIRDPDFFEWIEHHATDIAAGAREPLRELIRRCAELHMIQIGNGGDPFERGSARPLDFGHWAAHKLEVLSEHDVQHGEAVAIGIALDSHYSVLSGELAPGSDWRIVRLLERLGFTLWHPALRHTDAHGNSALLAGLEQFRAHLGGELCITLLSEIGSGLEVNRIDPVLMLQALDWLEAL